MRIAIMGAAGFIGTNLALALLKNKNNDLLLVDEKESYFAGSPVADHPRVETAVICFSKETDFTDLLLDCDLVFHLVSTTNPTTSNQHISDEITVNIAVTVNLLEACIRQRANRVVFVSSGGTVYGDASCPIKETAETNPINTYGIQKLAIEKLLYLYHHLHGLDYRIVRLSNPYGPYQRPNGRLGAVTTFMDRAMKDEQLVVYGDGTVVRDYIYIDDAIAALLYVALKDCKHRIYNVGSGEGVSLNEILDLIREIENKPIDVKYKSSRSVDLKMNYLDVSRYEKEFGAIAGTSLKDGLVRTRDFLKG